MILDAILRKKLEEVRGLCKQYSGESLVFEPATERHRFRRALISDGGMGVIAEVKRASPSAGVIRADLNPSELARAYEKGSASAVSVLTDETFFGGSREDLQQVRRAVDRPVLRKDFIIDELQVLESRRMGADAILLILSALSQDKAAKLLYVADSLDMDCLVEVHTPDELQRALDLEAKLIGINNRDLKTFLTDISTSLKMLDAIDIPDDIVVVSESGISGVHQVERLAAAGVDAVLVGEALVRAGDPERLIAQMRAVGRSRPKGHIAQSFDWCSASVRVSGGAQSH